MIGKTLGHYRVGEQLGRGGMGEVYVADDIPLDRKVALKFLPDAFTADPERMARFEREAKLLASLNHPNIAAIYGLEKAEGKRFIAMELVEGETLAQRLSQGAMPVDDALGICRQIAEGLEAAHEKGVIHRDLKPANVMITEGDKVKILDFGLAKALSDEAQSATASQSPTITEAMTQAGVILGTAAYMSPEQAKGKAVDKRADIWAFGCILYECLAGKRVFEGETVTETLAAVLTREPEWEKAPAKVHPLLHRCLERDQKKRLRDIGDAYALLESTPESAPVERPWLAWSVAVLAVLIAASLAFVHFREKAPSAAAPTRFQLALPDEAGWSNNSSIAISPDGRHLAFVGVGSDSIQRLWVRDFDSLEARPLNGTESPLIPLFFWSPDSRFIAFEAGKKLKKINVAGGPALAICNMTGLLNGGSWNNDGVIIFADLLLQGSVIMRVSAVGGIPSPVTELNRKRQERFHMFPVFLPDGRHFLYSVNSQNSKNTGFYIGSLDAKPEEQGSRQILATNSMPVYVPSQDSGLGWLLFLREQTLVAQSFDDKRLEPVGEPLPLAEQVRSLAGYDCFSASTTGVLIYMSGPSRKYSEIYQLSQLSWFDRQGKALSTVGEPGTYSGAFALSPDEARVAWTKHGAVFLYNLLQNTETRFTFGKGNSTNPIWSPDGNRVIFGSNRDGVINLYLKPASGAKEEELLLKSSESNIPTSWSRDGQFVLYGASDPKTKFDIWALPLEGDRKPIPFLQTEFREFDAHFSPDMRWVAYVSDESGSNEIYVSEFSKTHGKALPAASGKWLVSTGGGKEPRWRGDGKELYYLAKDGKLMAVEVTAGLAFQAGTPKSLFPAARDTIDISASPLLWDVAKDGSRFLITGPVLEKISTPLTVVLNWQSGLKK
jgi:eukaryotic-like serine/threonine-protein kinase